MSTDNPLLGVPIVHSPLFERIISSSDLSDEELRIARDLHHNGFAVIDFPDEQLDARIERIRQNLQPRFDRAGSPDSLPTEWSGRIQDAWHHDEDVRAIAANSAILELLTKLYGRRAFPFQTLNFPVGTEQAYHTDIVHFSSIPQRFMCGVWLAMEDVRPGSGALRYIRGSHHWPVMNNMLLGRRGWGSEPPSAQEPYQEVWDALIEAHGAADETFFARKGQALIWAANLLHGGGPRSDPTLSRWSQVTHYYFDDCVYYTPAHSDEWVGRLAMREIVDASTGKPVPNVYLGEEFPLPRAPEEPKGFRKFSGRFARLTQRNGAEKQP
jgi:hypothetical protein